MSEEYIIIPGTNRKVYDGTVVILNRLPNLKWIIHFGFYSYNGRSKKGWYLSSIPSCSVMPVFNEDLVAMRVVEDPKPPLPPFPPGPCPPPPHPPFPPFPPVPTPTIFTPDDKLMVDRSMITVESLEDRDKLGNDKTLDGKLVRVNDIDGEGTVEYYTWNKSTSQWDLATLGYRYLTRDEIDAKLADGIIDIVYSDSVGALVITDNTGVREPVSLTGLAHDPVFISDTLTLRIPVFGSSDVLVTIPRDKYLTGVRYEENYLRPDGTWGPSIVCTISDGVTETEVVCDASKLRNIYQGGETNEAVIYIEEGTNKITCEVKLSTFEHNALKLDNTGFYVDITGKVDKNDIHESYLLAADGQGGFTQAGNGAYLVSTGSIVDIDHPEKAVITANIVASAIDAAISTAVRPLQEAIAALQEEVSDLDERVTALENKPDQGTIIIDQRGIARDTLYLGGEVLTTTSDETLATEAAVVHALTFQDF